MDKRINIISDSVGKQIVVITDIRFQGKRNINWEEVEKYLKEYIGNCYEVVETADQIFISSDFPGELKGSKDTRRLLGANAKAKANATQGIPMLLQCATNRRWKEIFRRFPHIGFTRTFINVINSSLVILLYFPKHFMLL